jgi:hypothetical protein
MPNVLGRSPRPVPLLPRSSGGGARAQQGRRGYARAVLAAIAFVLCSLSLALPSYGQTPTPDDTLRAFRITERHIRDWALPADPAPAGPEIADAPKAVGACITLKLRGKVVGRGQAWSDTLAGADAANPLVLFRAIRAAMQQAEPELGVSNDAMRDAAIKLVAPELLISVELAGPLGIVEFNTWDDAELTLRPGLDGVAVRLAGDPAARPGPLHAIFPSQMMLTNMLPHRAMGAATAIAMGEGGAAAALDDPKKLREKSGLRMYRFRSGQVVQSGSASTPSVLYRGGSLLPVSTPITREALRTFAHELAQHVARRSTEFDGASVATSAMPAGLASRAIDAYLSITLELPDRSLELLHAKEHVSASLKFAYEHVHADEDRQALALAQTLGRTGNDLAAEREIRDAFLGGGKLPPEWKAGIPESVRACYALARVEPQVSPQCGVAVRIDEEIYRACIDDVLKTSGEGRLVSQMPWLGWAEIAAARKHDGAAIDAKSDIPSALALRRMREEVWKHQLSITDAGEDAMDMAGGIVFTSGVANGRGNPYPTWQCVRPLAFIATMLRDPRLTEPKERPEQIVRLMQAMRFLRQLQVDEASAWMYTDPTLAIGGIRASTWDNSLPIDATSMTLLCVVEMIKSLDALSPPPPQPASAPAPAAAPAK